MIFDLSYSINISINDEISWRYGEIIYEYLEKIIRLIAKTDREIVMIKYNLKSTFHHIPINPVDY